MGIGTDIEEAAPFAKALAKDDRIFFGNIFTRKEMEYCMGKKNPAEHLASRFAAKEAVIKALRCAGFAGKLGYTGVEITNGNEGVPQAAVRGAASKSFVLKLSMSNKGSLGCAVALAIKKG